MRAADVATAAGKLDQALLEMFYSTGLRLSEMAALCVHDVDWREGFVRVRRGKGGQGTHRRDGRHGARGAAALPA